MPQFLYFARIVNNSVPAVLIASTGNDSLDIVGCISTLILPNSAVAHRRQFTWETEAPKRIDSDASFDESSMLDLAMKQALCDAADNDALIAPEGFTVGRWYELQLWALLAKVPQTALVDAYQTSVPLVKEAGAAQLYRCARMQKRLSVE